MSVNSSQLPLPRVMVDDGDRFDHLAPKAACRTVVDEDDGLSVESSTVSMWSKSRPAPSEGPVLRAAYLPGVQQRR